jgi:hypothetical protein
VLICQNAFSLLPQLAYETTLVSYENTFDASLVGFDVRLLMMRQVSPSSVAKQRIISTELHPDLV